MKSSEEIEMPKEELQKINSIIGRATYNDYHWCNLIGIIKNLMQAHTDATLDTLKERVEDLPKSESIQTILEIIDEVRNE